MRVGYLWDDAVMVSSLDAFYAPDRDRWRKWLDENHGTKEGVWLVFYKARSTKPSLPYETAVEEALRYGWVDSLIKKIDEDRYARKFTPRKPHSKWSKSNIERIEKLVKEGSMEKSGLLVVEQSRINGEFGETKTPPKEVDPPAFLIEALAANEAALRNFNKLARSHRRQYILWLLDAKKGETKRKRLSEVISLLEKGEKLGLR
jgi:uncharacterized protein YdeI (YjbR/CyaY-like superfamily)